MYHKLTILQSNKNNNKWQKCTIKTSVPHELPPKW